MKSKTFKIRCTPGQAHALSEALRGYADAAYPPGGSECAQVARETLRDSAGVIERDASRNGGAALRRRQRTLIRSAIAWFYGDQGPGDAIQLQALLLLLDEAINAN